MSGIRLCDHGDCPAYALHHIDLYGQDFHFCGHHWAALSPVLQAHRDRLDAPADDSSDRAPGPTLTGSAPGRPGR
jgi:hypothetical protein